MRLDVHPEVDLRNEGVSLPPDPQLIFANKIKPLASIQTLSPRMTAYNYLY